MKNHSTTKQELLSIKRRPPPSLPHTILITLSIPLLLFGLIPPTSFASTTFEGNLRNVRNSPNPHHQNHARISGFSGGPAAAVLPWWKQYAKQRSQPVEDISLLLASNDKHVDSSTRSSSSISKMTMMMMKKKKGMNNETMILKRRKTKESVTKGIGMMDMDQIMNDMGAWSFHKDESSHISGPNTNNNNYYYENQNATLKTTANKDGGKEQGKIINLVDPTLSTVKIIPDEHHVSAFLNKGVVKRFLFVNDKFGNPLSITITPCTSILLWNVKFWPVSENGTEAPEHVKTYRTQRTVTFTEPKGRRGIYSIDIRPLHWDSYVHLYGTSFNLEPIRMDFETDFHTGFDKLSSRTRSSFPSENLDKFYQHSFTQADIETDDHNNNQNDDTTTNNKDKNRSPGAENPLNVPSSIVEGLQINTNTDTGEDSIKTSNTGSKPRIWVRRLRGNRLQVKWDTSPINPHLMNYCIVVNTRRDYSSLCSASGERFGVLPPDLMHVTYYGSTNENNNIMIDNNSNDNLNSGDDDYNNGQSFLADSPDNSQHSHHHRHRHGHRNHRESEKSESGNRRSRTTHEDIILGCVNKKTHYILNNLHHGRLYYFNVFLRDLSTNVSYPYVRTTLKYQLPKTNANGLRDAKPIKVKLSTEKSTKPTTLKFNLNKPCNELTIYVMPCGGGSIIYEALHGNRSVYESTEVDSLDVIKIGMPQRGKYFIKISQASNSKDSNHQHQARMAEVYVGKKNKRFPLPKLPPITTISEDESKRACDMVSIQWWPSPDPRDNEYCIFLKEESRKRVFQFKKPNQCDVEKSLKSDPYVTHSLCLQRTLTPEMMMLSQKIVGLQPGKTYVVHLIVRRHNGKSLSYDLQHVKTLEKCPEN